MKNCVCLLIMFFIPTNENIKDYSKMITETGEGGADVCYSSPGWAGHIAFVDPSS